MKKLDLISPKLSTICPPVASSESASPDEPEASSLDSDLPGVPVVLRLVGVSVGDAATAAAAFGGRGGALGFCGDAFTAYDTHLLQTRCPHALLLQLAAGASVGTCRWHRLQIHAAFCLGRFAS